MGSETVRHGKAKEGGPGLRMVLFVAVVLSCIAKRPPEIMALGGSARATKLIDVQNQMSLSSRDGKLSNQPAYRKSKSPNLYSSSCYR